LFGKLEGNEAINPQGCGLGLNIANLLATELGGVAIRLTSEPGQGSIFSFRVNILPGKMKRVTSLVNLRDEGLEVPGEPHEPLYVPRFNRSENNLCYFHVLSNILVVDDSEFNRLVMKKILNSFNLSCYEAANGLQAVEIIKKEAERNHFFKVIFMDLEMPEMDGMTAARLIVEMLRKGELPETTKVIACSAHSSETDKQACLLSGMNEYLEKPISKESVRRLLSEHSLIASR
jgi:CheY-like chemotaxis protein